MFNVVIDYMIRAVEAAKQGVKVGEDTLSGLMAARMALRGWQKHQKDIAEPNREDARMR